MPVSRNFPVIFAKYNIWKRPTYAAYRVHGSTGVPYYCFRSENKTEITAHRDRGDRRKRDGKTVGHVTPRNRRAFGRDDTVAPRGHCRCVCKRTREKRIHSESRSVKGHVSRVQSTGDCLRKENVFFFSLYTQNKRFREIRLGDTATSSRTDALFRPAPIEYAPGSHPR